MPLDVDMSSVFDTLLPNVYVKKVSLLPATEPGDRRGTEYSHGEMDSFQTNVFGKKVAPDTTIDYSGVPTGASGIMVKVDLSLKDHIGPNGRPGWYAEEILKHLNLRVVLSKNADMTNQLLQAQMTPAFLKKARAQEQFLERVVGLEKVLMRPLEEQMVQEIDGETTYDIEYTVFFYLENNKPEHLTVFANVFRDQNEVFRDRMITPKSTRNKFIQGYTTAQRILLDGDLASNAYVYILPTGKVWAGPVHSHQGGFMAGAFHSRIPHPSLKRRTVSNFFVEDYRIIEEISTPKLLLHPTATDLERPGHHRTSENLSVVKAEAYVSEPLYSFDENNRVKFLFHIKYNKLVENNTRFGAVLKTADPEARRQIFNGSNIKTLSVFRNRVQKGLRKESLRLVDFEDRTELVANSAETTAGTLPTSTISRNLLTYDTESRLVDIGAIKELNLGITQDRSIRTFGVTDFDMERKTDGLYRYTVEMEIEDGTVPFVKKQLSKLTEARKLLRRYYSESSRLENLDTKTGAFKLDYIKKNEEDYKIPSEEEILNNNLSDRTTIVDQSISSSPWLTAISTYTDVLYNLTDIKFGRLKRAARLLYKLASPSTGTLTGIETVLSLVSQLEAQIKLKVGTLSPEVDEVDYNADTGAFKGKPPRGIFRIVKSFNQVHDSNMQNKVGYDFLGGGGEKSIGPRLVSTEQYQTRLDAENNKYFAAPYSDDPIIDTTVEGDSSPDFSREMELKEQFYSYLTPAVIKMGDKNEVHTLDRGAGLWSEEQYNAIVSGILAASTVAAAPVEQLTSNSDPTTPTYPTLPPSTFGGKFEASKAPISLDATKINIGNSITLGALNVTVTSLETFNKKVATNDYSSGLEIEEAKNLDPKIMLGQNTKFATDPFEVEDISVAEELEIKELEEQKELVELTSSLVAPLISATSDLFPKTSSARKIEDLMSFEKNNIIDSYFDNKENGIVAKKAFLDDLPNQIKSIILGTSEQTRKDWVSVKESTGRDLLKTPDMYALFYMLYNHLNKVEVLTGFGLDDKGEPQILRPIYRKLDRTLFNEMKSKKMTMVCRMVSYSNSIVDFKKSAKLLLPEFDSVFLLGPNQAPPTENTPAEAVTSEAVFQTSNGSDVMDAEQSVYATRLTENVDLNTTGRKLMQDLVTLIARQDHIPPEFSSTATVVQPRGVTLVGTRFRSDAPTPPKPTSGVSSVLGSARPTSPQPTQTNSTGGTSGTGGSY